MKLWLPSSHHSIRIPITILAKRRWRRRRWLIKELNTIRNGFIVMCVWRIIRRITWTPRRIRLVTWSPSYTWWTTTRAWGSLGRWDRKHKSHEYPSKAIEDLHGREIWCLLRWSLRMLISLYLYDNVMSLRIEHVLGLEAGIVSGKCNVIMVVTRDMYKKNESLVLLYEITSWEY